MLAYAGGFRDVSRIDHVDDGTQNSTALERADDTALGVIIGVIEICFKMRKGNCRADDAGVVAKQKASHGKEGGRSDRDGRASRHCFR